MTRKCLPKLTIAILALSIALILLSAQSNQAAASPMSPQGGSYTPGQYNSSYSCSWNSPYYYGYCNTYYYYGYPNYYRNYYYGYPYYRYYYSFYPYYYSTYPYYYSYYYGYPSYYSNYYATPSSYTVTVATSPSNLGTVTGGGTFTQGSSASFSITQNTVQVSPNTRYVFSHWSGDFSGVGSSGTVTVNGAMTITAVYQEQYYLTVTAQPQSAPTPQGQGWYNASDTATLQNAGQTVGGNGGDRLLFQGWSVDGQNPQPSSSLSVVMNSPHSVTALYAQQYYLNVQTDQGVAYGSGWYDSGTTAQFSVSTPVSATYGVSIVFNGWQGDVQSSSQSTTVVMDGPKNVIATWRTDSTVLYLTVAVAIIAALVIVGAIVALLVKGRGSNIQPPATPPSTSTTMATPSSTTSMAPHDESTVPKKTEHHRKKATPEAPESSEQKSENPSEPTA